MPTHPFERRFLQRRCAQQGMTLVEVTVTLAILALAAAVVLPALRNASRAELRRSASDLAGTLRATYDQAVLDGQTYRLALSMDKPVVDIETIAQVVRFKENSFKDVWSASDPFQDKPQDPKFTSTGQLKLAEGVRILDVWMAGMPQPEREGTVYLYFFPHGYTQEAFIHLEDKERRVFTLQVAPLTGQADMVDHYLEAPQ